MANEEEPQQKLIITDSSKISEDMAPYYLKETFSDIQIILSDKTIHAHKIVLAARCKYFESLLMQDPKQAQIEVINAPSNAFETILYYIYTGTVVMASLDENYVSDILKLAHEYSLKTLVQIINKKMVSIVDLTNVCFLLNIANAHDMDELRETCHNFIDEHVSQMFEYGLNVLTQKSMVNLLKRDAFLFDDIEVFNIAANWCKINKDVGNLVIGCVRFPCLTRNEILNVVRPSKIVDDTKLLNILTTIENDGTQETLRFGGQLKDKNLATAEYNVKVISGLNATMLFEESRNWNDCAYHNMNDQNGITVDLGRVKCFNHITMCILKEDSSPSSFILDICLNQPYMISQIKVKLRFYSYISVIKTSETIDSKWEIVARSINEDELLTFNERTVNFIQITGRLSPNKTKDHHRQFLEDIECS
ncbi:BTB/POZ domain-containing protein 9-like isoform X2 [Zophobas morio]|uniref:BTB/POZ domain-containing protein 9-like isoform X2 n=1 Tax=Zophobas morio TaxID=2755281 RepID=UPI003083A388